MNFRKFFTVLVSVLLSGVLLLFVSPSTTNEVVIKNGIHNEQLNIEIDNNGFIKKASYKDKIFYNELNGIQCGINGVHDWVIKEKKDNKIVFVSAKNNIMRTYELDNEFTITITDDILNNKINKAHDSSTQNEKFILFFGNNLKKENDNSYIYNKFNRNYMFTNLSLLPLRKETNVDNFCGITDKLSTIVVVSPQIEKKINNSFNFSSVEKVKLNLYVSKEKSYLLSTYNHNKISLRLMPNKNDILNRYNINLRDYGWISPLSNILCKIMDFCASLGSSGFILYLFIFVLLLCPNLFLEARKNKTNETGVAYYVSTIYMLFILFYTSTKAIPYCFDLSANKFLWIKNLSIPEPNLLTLHGLIKIDWMPNITLLAILNGFFVYDQLDIFNVEDRLTKIIIFFIIVSVFSNFTAANLLIMFVFSVSRHFLTKLFESF